MHKRREEAREMRMPRRPSTLQCCPLLPRIWRMSYLRLWAAVARSCSPYRGRESPQNRAAPPSYSKPSRPCLPAKTRMGGLFISLLSTQQHLPLCLPLTEFRHFLVAPKHKKAPREHSKPYRLPALCRTELDSKAGSSSSNSSCWPRSLQG